jgi:hypothetical protein
VGRWTPTAARLAEHESAATGADKAMKNTTNATAGSLPCMVRRLVSWSTKSELPGDLCEQCLDSGYCGDMGPGVSGNHEYGPCDCDSTARARRQLARRGRLAAEHSSSAAGWAPMTMNTPKSELPSPLAEAPGSAYWPLWSLMASNHNLLLLESEMEDIIRAVDAIRAPDAETETAFTEWLNRKAGEAGTHISPLARAIEDRIPGRSAMHSEHAHAVLERCLRIQEVLMRRRTPNAQAER